ncbi:PIG-L deacetylase family protein [Deinococcus humi]|uniref:LmbE family N-acetylglucosaminyl deacetylase n=1 Tax=Deinococcus humi TaxID=662880 RepID=A0A7W8NGC3_9DEIO|nr:LmbE family N-acetylglucosaminyl deacetylase [Deinococcus humi]GGO34172.1 PIG-L domain-containing protein [Deinococcus humi]
MRRRRLRGTRFGSRRRDWALGAALLVALALAYAINAGSALTLLYPRAVATVQALPQLPAIRAGQSVLVISPHPDDESLCCGGLIAGAVRAGARVDIVWVTSGDGFELDSALLGRTLRPRLGATEHLGQRRMGEASAAAAALGVPATHLTFLGYPDGATLKLWRAGGAAVVRSPHTGATQVPYARAQSPGAAYTANDLEADLGRVLDRVQPALVLLPSTSDAHPDHVATSLFTQKLLKERGWTARARYWIVHGGVEWPVPKGLHEGFPLLIPPRGVHLNWQRADLDLHDEERKLAALKAHRSQMMVMRRFMEAFVRENELITVQETGNPADGTRSEQEDRGF